MGWQDDPIVSAAPAEKPAKQPWLKDPVVEQPGVMDKLGRQVGLLGRSAVTGTAALPAIGADALGFILNLGIDQYNKQTGSSVPRFEPQMKKLEQNLSAAGLPEPENRTERLVYRTNQALAGQGALIKAGKGTVLANRPDTQLQAAGGAGLAGEVAHEAGYGPLGEFIASLTGGIFAPGAISLTKGIPGLVEPFTTAGQRKIAGNVLADASSSPAEAKIALSNAESGVPGVLPTMGAATRDPGLASLERSLSAKPAGAVLQDRYLQNNAARVSELDNLAGSKEMISRAEGARDAATSASRDAALSSGRVGAPTDAVISNIDSVLKSPKGEREVVRNALEWAKGRIQGVTDPARLYEIRKDISDAMGGKLAGDKSVFKLASGELSKVKDLIDDAIESDAPGFKAYLQQYKDQSKPINQMEVLQEIRRRSLGTQEDRLGNRQVLASGVQRTMDDLDAVAADATGFKKARAEDILDKTQLARLEALRKDVTDAAFSQSGGKVSGSNTVQLANYSTANIIGRIAGGETGPITRNLGRGLDWLNKLNDRDIDRLLIEAAKDPALAGTLMKSASTDRIRLAADGLEQLARSMGIGAATASGTPKDKKDQGSRR